jgi:hypothetical protein
MNIPNHLFPLIHFVMSYVLDKTNDWFAIKKELINAFPPKDRSRFSRRHYSTKKHILNQFDYAIIDYWEKRVGVKLFIDKEKLHPENWEHKTKGWGIYQHNDQRRRQKETERDN